MVALAHAAVPAARADRAAVHGSAAGRGRVRRAWPAPRLAAALAALAGVLNLAVGAAAGRGRPAAAARRAGPRSGRSEGATAATAAAGHRPAAAGRRAAAPPAAGLAGHGGAAGRQRRAQRRPRAWTWRRRCSRRSWPGCWSARPAGSPPGRGRWSAGRRSARPCWSSWPPPATAALGLLANAGDVAGPTLGGPGPAGETGAHGGRARLRHARWTAGSAASSPPRWRPSSTSALLVVAARALAPALVRPARDPGLAAAVAASGDSLAYFALRDDRISVRDGEALVSWAPVGVVALAAGDPLGPPARWPAAVAAFLDRGGRPGPDRGRARLRGRRRPRPTGRPA